MAVGDAPRDISNSVQLRPARRSDWPMIDSWLGIEEIKRWWGSHPAAQAAVLAALDAPMGLCSIIEAGGVPVGYAHALEAEVASDVRADPSLALCYRIDAFVGERDHRGRGIGEAALRLVFEEVFATTLAPAVFSVVPIRNEAAVRAHEKAGFGWVRVIDDTLLGPCWLMRRERADGPAN